jgi:hypothetical protein
MKQQAIAALFCCAAIWSVMTDTVEKGVALIGEQ